MSVLEGKLVLLGVTGGIAAYRSCELARRLVKAGASVQVIMTDYASRFVGPLTFQALTGRPVEVGHGGHLARAGMEHIDLGRRAHLIVVAPATANTLAKLAWGLADNLLTTTLLASACPVVLAPAMNTHMWHNPVTAENVRRLQRFERFRLVGPAEGDLACGEEGAGRMAEPDEILSAGECALTPQDLAGRFVLVSAGPTREFFDPVRFLTNRSTGRMGYALAAAAAARGARVVLVSGPTALASPWGVERVSVVSAAEMAAALTRRAEEADAVLMAAAVADFTPGQPQPKKIKKADASLTVEWARTADILACLGREKPAAVLVGFTAETGDPVPAAKRKLEAKHLNLVVANDVSDPAAGFAVDTNRVHLVDRDGVESLALMSKRQAAERILDRVVALLAERGR